MRKKATVLSAAMILLLPFSIGVDARAPQGNRMPPHVGPSLAPAPAPSTAAIRVEGIVRTASHQTVPFAPLRLRDARTGQIVGTTMSDPTGAFSFGTLPSGFYVVELTDRAGNVLATSPLINADAGDFVSTLVRLPDRFFAGGVLGSATGGSGLTAAAGTLTAITTAAATAGVLAVAAGRPISPEQ